MLEGQQIKVVTNKRYLNVTVVLKILSIVHVIVRLFFKSLTSDRQFCEKLCLFSRLFFSVLKTDFQVNYVFSERRPLSRLKMPILNDLF